jgi:putative spermidine/putrescine transport system permease protein
MGNRHAFILRLLLIGIIIAVVLPILVIIIWSFAKRWAWSGLLPTGITLRGIEELFGEHSNVLNILASSIALSMTVAIVTTIIGLMTARAVALYDFYGKKLILFGSILPIIVPSTVFAMGIHVIFIKNGLNDTIAGVIITHVICALPYAIHILSGVTSNVGDDLEVQAQVLGCSPVRGFFLITFPLLLPGIMSSMIMAYIISFSQYFLTLLIGGGKVKTLSVVMIPFITGGDRTLASVYALLFIISSVSVFIVFELIIRRFTKRIIEMEG